MSKEDFTGLEISPNPLGKLPVINRIKAVKDLFLARFESLDSKINSLLENDTALLQRAIDLAERVTNLALEDEAIHQNLDFKINELLENDTLLLQGAIDLAEGVTNLTLEDETIQQQLETIQQQLETTHPRVIKFSASDPKTRLMTYLYSYLSNRRAIDIGANIGDVSEKLLEAGYEVYAFEPFLEVFEKLKHRFSNDNQFHGYPVAVGSTDETKEFHLAQDQTEENIYKDSTFYNSLTKHAMPGDIIFTSSITVPVRSLESLHASGELPDDIGLVQVDTEGFDLEVLRGMGNYRYPVVVAEFWDSQFPFGLSEAFNRLDAMVGEMKAKSYCWHLVIYRVWGSDEVLFYCNHPESIEKSWGNVFFFQEYSIFSVAAKWCSSVLREAHFM